MIGGYRLKSENLKRLTIHTRHLTDVPVSRNWYKTVSKTYENLYMKFCICIKVVGLNRSYSTNTKPIWKRRYPTETENPVIIIKNIIDNNITCSPNSPYYVSRTWANSSAVYWSRDFRLYQSIINYIY